MGAQQFAVAASGQTPEEAFKAARDEALYEYGHRGYTGTIAEKSSFIVFRLPEGKTVSDFLNACNGAQWDEASGETVLPDWIPEHIFNAYDDKWGPCIAIEVAGSKWAFCGWASS